MSSLVCKGCMDREGAGLCDSCDALRRRAMIVQHQVELMVPIKNIVHILGLDDEWHEAENYEVRDGYEGDVSASDVVDYLNESYNGADVYFPEVLASVASGCYRDDANYKAMQEVFASIEATLDNINGTAEYTGEDSTGNAVEVTMPFKVICHHCNEEGAKISIVNPEHLINYVDSENGDGPQFPVDVKMSDKDVKGNLDTMLYGVLDKIDESVREPNLSSIDVEWEFDPDSFQFDVSDRLANADVTDVYWDVDAWAERMEDVEFEKPYTYEDRVAIIEHGALEIERITKGAIPAEDVMGHFTPPAPAQEPADAVQEELPLGMEG